MGFSEFLLLKSPQAQLRIPLIVPQHPNPDICAPDIVQKMIRETIQIAAPKSTPVKMEVLWVRGCLPDPNLKLGEEILSKLLRHAVIPAQDRVQIRLHALVESNVHGAEARQPVGQT